MTESRATRIARAAATSRLGFVLWVAIVTLLAVPLLFAPSVRLGPGTVEAGVAPAWGGRTELALPPLGTVSAPTHTAPVALGLELREVDVIAALDDPSAVGASMSDPVALIESRIRDDLGSALGQLAFRLLGVAALSGAIAAAAYPGRRTWARIGAGALVGPAAIAVLVAPAAIDFDPDALARQPQLTGQLAAADELVARVGSLETAFGSVESRARVLSERLAGLYSAAVDSDIERSEGEVVLLHVSDLHLNAVGLALARDLAMSFDVDAILDTGDITSFGYAPEAAFIDLLGEFEVPYYLVAGNHDSEAVRARLADSDDVVLLDDETVEIAGLTVLGVGDPTVTALRRIPRDELDETYRDQFATTRRLVDSEEPDLLAVHNPVQARPVLGRVPAVAAGHLHRSDLEIVDGTVLAVVGTSGATGVGNLLADEELPYSFQLLRFVDDRLVAVDQLELRGADGDLVLVRRLLSEDEEGVDPDEADLTEEEVDEIPREEMDPEDLERVTSTTTTTTTPTTPTTAGPDDEEDDG